jgi:preprotein translocase SecE subunit
VAEEPKTPRTVKPAKGETVRDKVEKTAREIEAKKSDKPRRLRVTTQKATAPLRPIGRFLVKLAKPLRYIIPPYFRNSWRELKLVTWPNRRETFRLTGAVIAFSIVFGGVVAAVDYGLDKLFREVLLK